MALAHCLVLLGLACCVGVPTGPADPTPAPCPLAHGRGPAAARAAAFCAPAHGLGPALRSDALARDRRCGVGTTVQRPPVNPRHACWPPRPALSCGAGRGENATEGQGLKALKDSGGESQARTRCVDSERM